MNKATNNEESFMNLQRFCILSLSALITLMIPLAGMASTKPLKPSKEYLKSSTKVQPRKIKEGDTLYSILRQHRFNKEQISSVLTDSDLPDLLMLVPGASYHLLIDQQAGRKDIRIFDLNKDIAYLIWSKANDAGVDIVKPQFDITTKKAEGKVIGSLIASISKHFSSKMVAYRFMDAYKLNHNLRRMLQRGAHFSLKVEKKHLDGHFVKYGEVLETELEVKGKIQHRSFVRFDEGGGAFIDPFDAQTSRPLYAPVNYVHLSSMYNPRRRHPIKGRVQAHLGIDFALPQGEDVYASYAGTILRTGKNRAAGRYVVIKHPNGLETYYNHLSEIAAKIQPGAYVVSGQKIGEIGCSGYCTKPHLHFAVKKRGRFINPAPLVKTFPYTEKSFVQQKLVALREQGTRL